MELLTFEERERYNMLSDDEVKAYEAGITAGLDKFSDYMGELAEVFEHYADLTKEYTEDLEEDIVALGRYSPFELIEDKEIKKRYEQAIKNFDDLNTKMQAYKDVCEGLEIDSHSGIDELKPFSKYEENYNVND